MLGVVMTGGQVGKWFVCGPAVYRFEGVLFEVHSYCGPWPLRQDGEPRRRAGRRFWRLWDRFQALSPEERERCRL